MSHHTGFECLDLSLGLIDDWSCSDFTFMRHKWGVLGFRVAMDANHHIIDVARIWTAGNENTEAWDFLNAVTKQVIDFKDTHVEVMDMVKAGRSSFHKYFPLAHTLFDAFHRWRSFGSSETLKSAYRRLASIPNLRWFEEEYSK